MKNILLILMIPVLLSSFTTLRNSVRTNESEAQTYLKLYTTVTGAGEEKQENWMLANNDTRRIVATIQIISATDEDGKANREIKNVIVEAKSSLALGVRSVNGASPNTVVIISAMYTPAT